MKRLIIVTLTLVAGISFQSQAQTESSVFYFKSLTSKLDESSVHMNFVNDHFLGEEVAIKLEILRNSYTWLEPESPTQLTPRTIIEKPVIYNNVKRIEKFYKKQLKSGALDESQAKAEFGSILDIAIFIRNQQTSDFEAVLRSLKTEEEVVALFTKSVRLENY